MPSRALPIHISLVNSVIAIPILLAVVQSLASPRFDCDLETKLLPNDGNTLDLFGAAVGVAGDAIFIGAYNAGLGAVYVYASDGDSWFQMQKVVAGDGEDDDGFGKEFAVSGEVLLVGAPTVDLGSSSDAGAIYFFRHDGKTWSEEQKLVAPDGVADDEFGGAVALCGEVAVVGVPYDRIMGLPFAGSVHLFEYDGSSWTWTGRLIAGDAEVYGYFGGNLALSENVLLVGATGPDTSSAIYVFRHNGSTWVQEQKIIAEENTNYTAYGNALALWGEVALFGAPTAQNDNDIATGSAYLYRFDGTNWFLDYEFALPELEDHAAFGGDVAIEADTALIGASGLVDTTGYAYLFRFDGMTWEMERTLQASEDDSPDFFGAAVALSSDNAVVGALEGDDNGYNSGSAYVYEVAPDIDCDDNGINDQCDPDTNSNGVADACEPECHLQFKLLAAEGEEFDFFGVAAAIDGGTAIVRDIGDNGNGTFAGAAYIFRHDGAVWAQEQKLLASDGSSFDTFGFSVALDGDVALIGAVRDSDNGYQAGSAYVFRFDGATWAEEQKILPADGAAEDLFGWSAAVIGDVALIGTGGYSANTPTGSAYVFRYDGSSWIQEQKLFGDLDVGFTNFGYSVALSADSAVIGAIGQDDNGTNSGAAYVFRYDQSRWMGEAKLLPTDGAADEHFGLSVALSNDTIVVGTPEDSDDSYWTGAAYVFRNDDSSWVQEQKLTAPDPTDYDFYGVSVGISDGRIIVGANKDDDKGEDSGAAYVYLHDGTAWILEEKLLAYDGAPDDEFGGSVAISGKAVVVGAVFDEDNGEDAGSAYIFVFPGGPGDCNENGFTDSCEIADGNSADDNGNGTPDECETPVCDGDANGDGVVDPLDSGYVLARFGCPVGTGNVLCDAADANLDLIVDPLDVGYVLSRFGECP